jgi:hypothetical protein
MIYTRMEELSFRTGAATVAGVLAVAATAILLTLTQGGHHAAPPRAQAGLASSSFVAAPEAVPLSPSAAHQAHTRRPAAAPDVPYVPSPSKTPTVMPQPSPSPTPHPPRHGVRAPVTHGPPSSPGFPWPWSSFP